MFLTLLNFEIIPPSALTADSARIFAGAEKLKILQSTPQDIYIVEPQLKHGDQM